MSATILPCHAVFGMRKPKPLSRPECAEDVVIHLTHNDFARVSYSTRGVTYEHLIHEDGDRWVLGPLLYSNDPIQG